MGQDLVASWFTSTGEELVLPTFIAAPHAEIDRPGTRMARIAVRPTWVGLMDFQARMPSALGGVVSG